MADLSFKARAAKPPQVSEGRVAGPSFGAASHPRHQQNNGVEGWIDFQAIRKNMLVSKSMCTVYPELWNKNEDKGHTKGHNQHPAHHQPLFYADGGDKTWHILFSKGQFKSTCFRMTSMTPVLTKSLSLLKTLLDNYLSSSTGVLTSLSN